MKRTICLVFAVCLASAFIAPGIALSASDNGQIGKDKKDAFDLTGRNITSTFKKFEKCNAGKANNYACTSDFSAPYFLFDYDAIQKLRNYHVIMLPGGDYDFFSELVTLCEGEMAEDLESLFTRYPLLGMEIKASIEKEVCPDYMTGVENYYDKYMDAYIEYEQFFGSLDIAFTRLQFSKTHSPKYFGDRDNKVSLLADTIDKLEAQYGDNNSKDYILMGHSFGGLNITDFLMELVGAHVPGTPEDRLFDNTTVRNWPAEKKERIFKKIKGVALLNTFVQGLRTSELKLIGIGKANGVKDDVLEHYINRVLNNYTTEEFESDNLTRDNIYHLALRSNRYRGNYYLKDKNSAVAKEGTPIQDALNRIATEKAVISIGCLVPRFLPDFKVQPNLIVNLSKKIWKNESVPNDGLVETYATILPHASVEYLLLPNLDHGALVLKPQVRGISIGHNYDQQPFIKTLFKRMMTKIDEIPAN